MLEQPRKTGTKVISHMLTSHGGELYIHVLATQRSCLEDPPSVSEGSGGRITDYRITVSMGLNICSMQREKAWHKHYVSINS